MTMESALSGLEALFHKAQSDINYASHRLDYEFNEVVAPHGLPKLNPLRLMQRYEALQARMEAIERRHEETSTQKTDLTQRLARLALDNRSMLADLERRAAVQPNPNPQDDQHLVDLCRFAGCEVAPNATAAAVLEEARPTTAPVPGTVPAQNSHNATSDTRSDGSGKENTTTHKTKPPAKTPAGPHYEPVSEPEFENVSTLVRGRCKLADINRVYETLVEYYAKQMAATKKRKNHKIEPLTTSQLVGMGLKITGQTGEAKLKPSASSDNATWCSRIRLSILESSKSSIDSLIPRYAAPPSDRPIMIASVPVPSFVRQLIA
ncbi:uncharacterized protein MONBRDRAFT_38370 [Monosiga brevicollis MX1]|uniref:Protein FAM33A n=1 Tax=Monosiga brevicollis TaxID=81824 RepID=A9V7A3_MONBE|nr:uncharacterized protein MONBRDRAFT_38370 [Monosiga brevicollis MX1]EDQ86549.1 predicted protein [Monosiga brevicollis MX1]|eukprot:XP_001748662.1 hypothetical protein [Monosiga brevicollis MX1]